MSALTISPLEAEANAAISAALEALRRAVELSECAGYGSLVSGPLYDAIRDTKYSLDIAEGRL